MTLKCLVYSLNGQYSGICGGTSYTYMSNLARVSRLRFRSFRDVRDLLYSFWNNIQFYRHFSSF